MPDRVLYIANSEKIGGANRVLMQMAANLDRDRFEPAILAPGEGPLAAWARASGIECRLGGPRSDAQGRTAAFVRSVATGVTLLAGRFQLIHALAPLCYRTIGLAAGIAGVPRICHLQSPASPAELAWCFRFAPEAVVACNESLGEEVRPAVASLAPKARLLAIPNPVDTEAFTPRAEPAGPRKRAGEKVVVIVGHLSEVKGYPWFLDAAARIARCPSGARVTFAALGGETTSPGYRRFLEDRARELGIADRVRFLGFTDDVAGVLRAADIFVLPSLSEGLPLAVLEGMACGLPVVATPVGGTPEAVVDGVTGFLVPPRDAEALAASIRRLLADPALAHRMGRAGRRRVEDRFSLRSFLSSIQDLYEEVRATRPPARARPVAPPARAHPPRPVPA